MSFMEGLPMGGKTEGGYEFSEDWNKLMAEIEEKKKRWAEKRAMRDDTPKVDVNTKVEVVSSMMCHCGLLATAGITVKDDVTGDDVHYIACRRCHPKAAEMMDLVNDVMKGRRDASDITFTPEQMIETLYKEEEESYAKGKVRGVETSNC